MIITTRMIRSPRVPHFDPCRPRTWLIIQESSSFPVEDRRIFAQVAVIGGFGEWMAEICSFLGYVFGVGVRGIASCREMVSKTTSDNERPSRLSVKRVRNARRRRLEFRRMKPKCQSETDVGDRTRVDEREVKSNVEDYSTEISLSFSSSSPSSSDNDAIPAKKTEGSRSFPPPSYGTVSVIGRRREMEDAVRVELGFWSRGGERYDFFGVYDGHGGARVAEVCRERLHRVLAEEIEKENCRVSAVGGGGGGSGGWERAMKRCFGKVDEEVVSEGCCRKENGAVNTVGSTAVVAVVGRDVVVVANCGDSRAVICRDGVALPLSNDHKPNRPDELKRVEAAGGRVINWDGYRVLGVLATSRSIGDQHLKPFVISEPEVTVSERTDADEFLILASDGLWDVMSNEVACRVVRRCLDGRAGQIRKIENGRSSHAIEVKSGVAEAATLLIDMAMSRGSRDNISAVVVELKKANANFCQ